MKIYTKTGDDGSTSLLGGGSTAGGSGSSGRVRKSDPRIDCYGHIDELNAMIGWAVVATGAQADLLRSVQKDLFVIGSHLAVADGAPPPASLPVLEEAIVSRLEMQIDAAVAALPPLRNFILPGGSELSARLHIARTVCRRTERRVVQFAMDRPVSPIVVTYLNRLSDWLFVQARAANHENGLNDVTWSGRS